MPFLCFIYFSRSRGQTQGKESREPQKRVSANFFISLQLAVTPIVASFDSHWLMLICCTYLIILKAFAYYELKMDISLWRACLFYLKSSLEGMYIFGYIIAT